MIINLPKALGGAAANDDDIKAILDKLEFVDYIDHGERTKDVRCMCNTPLRYEYIVKNRHTGDTISFGKTHFERHTQIPSNIVSGIVRGIDNLDYELDEMLYKIMNGWDAWILSAVEEYAIEVPKDIEEQLELSLPLLDKQIDSLRVTVEEEVTQRKKEKQAELDREREEKLPSYIEMVTEEAERIAYDCETNDEQGKGTKKSSKSTNIEEMFKLELRAQAEVRFLLDKYEIIDVLTICEELSYLSHTKREKYLTGKPKIYPKVALYLDTLADKGCCKLIDVKGTDNRVYAKTY